MTLPARPPSFTPVSPVARPDMPWPELLEPAAPSPTEPRARRRVVGALLGLVAAAMLALGALALTGVAPWDREPEGATALDAKLERAISKAIVAAEKDGVALRVTSGLRSYADQEALWAEGIETHGSEAEAARWVLPPDVSTHVEGLAVDVGPADGAAWLGEHGARWGLCQVYANEPWHFERVTKNKGTCPAPLPDAASLLDR